MIGIRNVIQGGTSTFSIPTQKKALDAENYSDSSYFSDPEEESWELNYYMTRQAK